MIKKLKQIIFRVMIVCMITVVMPFDLMDAYAASAKISFSDPSVLVGNEVNVTMKISGTDAFLSGADVVLSYDPNALEFVSGTSANGGAGTVKIKNDVETADKQLFQYSLKFKTLKAGNTKITVRTQEVYDVDSQLVTISKTGESSVKITSPASFSNDASLTSLKISPGNMSPAFSSATTSYQAVVGGDVSKIIVSAGSSNANAKVVTTGTDNLKIGENKVVCKVTAEDGQTTSEYVILVTKTEEVQPTDGMQAGPDETIAAEIGDLSVMVGKQNYSIATSFDALGLPSGYEAVTFNYKNSEIMAGKKAEKEPVLIYLLSSEGKGGFYLYDSSSDRFEPFVKAITPINTIQVLPLPEGVVVPEGFEENEIQFDGEFVTSWVWSADKDQRYCIFYGENEKGVKDFYRFDPVEKTVQRYFQDPNVDTGVSTDNYVQLGITYNNLRNDYRIRFVIIVALIVLCLFLIAVIFVLIKRGKGGGTDHSIKQKTNKKGRGSNGSDQEEFSLSDIYLEEEAETVPDDLTTSPTETEENSTNEVDDFDDFEEESLEDVERALAGRLAKASKIAAQPDQFKEENAPQGQTQNQEIRTLESDDDDEFEFMDI